MTYDKITIELTNYKKEFWNLMMKGTKGNYENLKGGEISNEMFVLPYDSNKKYNELINDECVFRRIATNIKANNSDHTLFVSDSDDVAEWNLTNIEDIKNEQEKITNTSSFLNLVKCYTNITKLDAEIIRTFIEKVYIYNADTIGTKKIKKIKIVFNFIGEIDLPTENKQ